MKNWQRIEFPEPARKQLKIIGSCEIKAFQQGDLRVLISTDAGRIHMSISHTTRNPVWEEIRDARYELLPLAKCFVMALPPPQHYINIHSRAFHLWEVLPQEKELIQLFSEGM